MNLRHIKTLFVQKYFFLLLILMVCHIRLFAQSAGYNYVRTRTANREIATAAKLDQLTSSKDSVQTLIKYIDGIGRPLQTVQMKGSPGGNDIVQPVFYDQFGREAKKYLPYALSTTAASDGSYKTDALTAGYGVANFYNPSGSTGTQQTNGVMRTASPFAITGFEQSPLNRVVEQGAPGDAWQFSGTGSATSSAHTIKVVYTTNDQTDFNAATLINNPGSHKVSFFTAGINSNQSRTLNRANNTAVYSNGAVYLTITKNENWQPNDGCLNTTEEYKDKEGHVVLMRVYNLKGTALEMISTYYVYDDDGNLCFVLPPGANPDDTTGPVSQASLQNFCYQYRYDQRQRLVQKKLPGKGWQFFIYNKLNQPVATQDSVQRMKTTQEWTITKYDALGRPIISGVYQHAGSSAGADMHITIQGLADSQTSQWETPVTTGNGYTTTTWPASWVTTLNINYYDNYTAIPGLPVIYDQHTSSGYSQRTYGLLTASKVSVLNSTDMLWNVSYYDDKGRTIKKYQQHYLGGNTAVSPYNYNEDTLSYNFSDQIIAFQRKHYVKNAGGTAAVSALTIVNSYSYDHMGRNRTISQQLRLGTSAPQATVIVAQYDYNEIGQLKVKRLHSVTGGQAQAATLTLDATNSLTSGQSQTVTASQSITLSPGFTAASGSFFQASIASGFLQNVDYRYNARGWLASINNGSLAADGGITNSDTNDQFGMELSYETATTAKPQYSGNIASVKWKAGAVSGATQPQYTFDYAYDCLNRLTEAVSSTGGVKNNLFSEYLNYNTQGNVTALGRYDKVGTARTQIDTLSYTYNGNQHTRIDDGVAGTAGFNDAVKVNNEYTYDGNGNAQADLNKGISSITYNALNLPQIITTGSGTVAYIYDAAGNVLRKIFTSGSIVKNTDYISGIQYADGTIEFLQTAEGRARLSGTTFIYEYDLKDNLGNTRVTIKADPNDVTQTIPLVLQQNSYYTFGASIKSLETVINSPKIEYLYNHKELQEETGLYNYGARFYDPLIGRWTTADPLAENYTNISPYAYVANNPVNQVDPDGRTIANNSSEQWRNDVLHWTTRESELLGEMGQYQASLGNKKELSQFDKQTLSTLNGAMAQARVRVDMLMAMATSSEIYVYNYGWAAQQNSTGTNNSANQGGFNGNNLDPSTIGHNWLWSVYIGPNNPISYDRKRWDYSVVPTGWTDLGAKWHDLDYDKIGATGAKGVFTNTRAIGADYSLVAFSLWTATNGNLPESPADRLKGVAVGLGIGIIGALPKTIGYGFELFYNSISNGISNIKNQTVQGISAYNNDFSRW